MLSRFLAFIQKLRPCPHFECVFVVIENASIDSLPQFRFDAFSTVHNKSFDVSWTLCYKHTRLRYFGSSFSFWCDFDRFRPSTTIHTNTICLRLNFDPLSRAISNRCVFDENAKRISGDRRPKRIEMYASFKQKRIKCGRGLKLFIFKVI